MTKNLRVNNLAGKGVSHTPATVGTCYRFLWFREAYYVLSRLTP